ncbi:defensin-1-like [Haemaphysalis longicornis]
MRLFSAAVLLGILLCFLTMTSGTEVDPSKPLVRVRRGFGCPWSEWTCHEHCQSIGRRGGYCGNFRLTCYCYKD